MPTIEPVTAADVDAIASLLRAADVAELTRAGSTVADALAQALRLGGTLVARGNRPMCVFGRLPSGAVWLLGTDEIKEHQVWFLRRSKAYIRTWLAMGPVWTISDPQNDLHREWLHWLGFQVVGQRVMAGGAVFDVMEAAPCAIQYH